MWGEGRKRIRAGKIVPFSGLSGEIRIAFLSRTTRPALIIAIAVALTFTR
jgi:hypothetical protein